MRLLFFRCRAARYVTALRWLIFDGSNREPARHQRLMMLATAGCCVAGLAAPPMDIETRTIFSAS